MLLKSWSRRRTISHTMAAFRPFSQEDSQLIVDLHALHKKSPKLVKPSQYAAPALPDVTVETWKMNEFKYYDVPSPFPTLARGLFSIKDQDAEHRYQIVVRGYDKFFNIGEVPWTTVRIFPHHLLILTACMRAVGIPRSSYQATVYPNAQIERMYHLRRGAVAVQAPRHF